MPDTSFKSALGRPPSGGVGARVHRRMNAQGQRKRTGLINQRCVIRFRHDRSPAQARISVQCAHDVFGDYYGLFRCDTLEHLNQWVAWF